MELTNAIRKTISSLDSSKGRRETGWFKAEGMKCVRDTLGHFRLQMLIVSAERFESIKKEDSVIGKIDPARIAVAPRRLFAGMSHLSTPCDIIAVYEIPDTGLDYEKMKDSLVLALDGVQDPGNLGTIMRAADWFGVHNIICSEDCADAFSPKSVMASMGAISRVRPVKCNLRDTISEIGSHVFGTTLEGENIYGAELSETGVIVMGSEGRGVSDKIRRLFSRELFIPSYPPGDSTSESLNVGMATSIILSEFRRRLY